MKKPVEIRKILALTQRELADMLQVSRSAINLYEIGKRTLPNAATIKLGQMIIAYNLKTQNKIQPVHTGRPYAAAENTARLAKELQQKAAECRAMAAQALQQLQAMKVQYESMAFCMNMIGTWMGNTAAGAAGEKARLHYEIQREELSGKLIKVGLQEQFILQQQAAVYVNNAIAHESALDELNRGKV